MLDRFKEYELFSKRTQRLSERRQVASQHYVAINTVIFGVLAFLVKDAGFRGWGLIVVSLPLFIVGGLTCLIWYRIITQFREIIGWHYQQLREMEQSLPESKQIYSKEWEHFFKPQPGRGSFGFSRLEVWLPRFFLGLYGVYVVGLTVAVALGWL
jgi:hypothetical protein